MSRVVFVIALMFATVEAHAQYGPSAIALAVAGASIDDIVSAGALAAAYASGEDASSSAAAAASAGDDDAFASASASASTGTSGDDDDEPAPTKKVIKAPTHTKVLYVPVAKREQEPKEAPIIVIKKEKEEKTCDTILENLLECAEADGEATAEVPYECLEKVDITVEDLIECGYVDIAPIPEPEPESEAPKPMKKVQPVTYKKTAVVEEPSSVYYTKKTMPEPVPMGPSASASVTATAGPGGDAAALSYASVSGDDAAAATLAAASAMGM